MGEIEKNFECLALANRPEIPRFRLLEVFILQGRRQRFWITAVAVDISRASEELRVSLVMRNQISAEDYVCRISSTDHMGVQNDLLIGKASSIVMVSTRTLQCMDDNQRT